MEREVGMEGGGGRRGVSALRTLSSHLYQVPSLQALHLTLCSQTPLRGWIRESKSSQPTNNNSPPPTPLPLLLPSPTVAFLQKDPFPLYNLNPLISVKDFADSLIGGRTVSKSCVIWVDAHKRRRPCKIFSLLTDEGNS